VRLYRRRHGQIPGRVYWGALLLRESIRAAMGKSTSKAAVRALLSPSRMRETPGPHSLRTAKSASNRQDAPTPLS
jgi:N-acetylglucosaminyl-diphospho-decaprenol L-rhamnosyltransferase